MSTPTRVLISGYYGLGNAGDEAILAGLIGKRVRINPTGFRNDIAMLRYDESVFVPRASRL